MIEQHNRREEVALIKMLITFRRKQGMSLEAFKAYRREVHAPRLFAIPEAAKIRRFVISYPVAARDLPEPHCDAVVEAWFDSIKDMDTLFLSENFKTTVDPDHVNFIDLASLSRVVLEEIVVRAEEATQVT